MVKEFGIDEIFEEREDGSIRISENAPSTLTDAIKDAKNALDSQTDLVFRDVGKKRRALDYGVEEFAQIQTDEATLFISKAPEGVEILAVGVSRDGPLSTEQIEEVMSNLAQEAEPTTEETLKSQSASIALRSINQSRQFVVNNCSELSNESNHLELLLASITERRDEIPQQSKIVATKLHNLLSSVYTFTETVDNGIKSLSVARQTKHHLQKYEDSVSAAIGLRHCIQHNIALDIIWLAKYSKQKNIFEYTIGVPLHEVNRSDFYYGKKKDASGRSYEPKDYYYRDESDYLIDIEKMSYHIQDSTNSMYDDLKSDLIEEDIEEVEVVNRYGRMTKWRIKKYLNEESNS